MDMWEGRAELDESGDLPNDFQCIMIGGPDENIAEVAETLGIRMIFMRDQEGRYLRNYQETLAEIISGYRRRIGMCVIGYISPGRWGFDANITDAFDRAKMDRVDPATDLSISQCELIAKSLVANLSDCNIAIRHYTDKGAVTATERYCFAQSDAPIDRICEAIETVFSPHNSTYPIVRDTALDIMRGFLVIGEGGEDEAE